MDERVALIGIIVENEEGIPKLNELLHENAKFIIGRMGLPYEKRGENIISIAIDAPQDVISTLSGRIGQIRGMSSKVIYSPKQ